MKTAAKRKPKPLDSFARRYRSALLEHLKNPSEAALGRAYELGRTAISERKSLLEIASLHHRALQEILRSKLDAKFHKDVLDSATGFLTESLSPFEMTHRGFQDAVKALRHLNETLEKEIKRIAYAVHDEAGQLLVAVHLALAEVASTLPIVQRQQLANVQGLLRQVEEQLRRYSHELRPAVLDDLGWISAIRFLADGVSKRAGLPVHINTNLKGRLPASQETVVYRVVQEALTNAAKHSKATRVRIHIRRQDRTIRCSIHDDGVGFDQRALYSNHKHNGLGIIAMRERLNAIGGTLSIISAPGRGTQLDIQIPTETPNAHSYRPRG